MTDLADNLSRAERANRALRAVRNDRWYPRFHIAAPAGWINDPNGLSHAFGRYQVYFQHHPYSSQWGPMHWGHVSSEDLVTWRREPIALAPSTEEDRDGVFSGSAVVGDDGRLYALYTGHRWRNGVDEREGNLQVQCLATSEDGVRFRKHGVVVEGPAGLLHFRDPKVWRTGETWYMVLGACSEQQRGEVWLYSSADLTTWEFDCVLFRDPDPATFMVECPDLFPVGDHWVLMYCPMGPRASGYRARNAHNAGYVVGEWSPGCDFLPLTEYRPVDWGHNFYAPQTFLSPEGHRLMIGWMGSFAAPVASQAEDSWSGQLTVPRILELGEGLHLTNRPVPELARLRGEHHEVGELTVRPDCGVPLVREAEAVEVRVTLDLVGSSAERVGLSLGKEGDGRECVFIAYDDQSGRVVVDRRGARHGEKGYRSAPAEPDAAGQLRLHLLIDRGSVEVFVQEGRESLTSVIAPEPGGRTLTILAEAGEAVLSDVSWWRLGGIWRDRDPAEGGEGA